MRGRQYTELLGSLAMVAGAVAAAELPGQATSRMIERDTLLLPRRRLQPWLRAARVVQPVADMWFCGGVSKLTAGDYNERLFSYSWWTVGLRPSLGVCLEGDIMKKIIAGAVTIGATAALGLAGGVASASSAPSAPANSQWLAGYTADHDNTGINENRITANWIEPKVIPHGYHDAYAAFLVGFTNGGGLDPTMPQIGTEADSIGGKPRYYAWYSPQPGGLCGQNCSRVAFRNSVRPGDRMSASVVVRGPLRDHLTLKLADVRYRKHRQPLRWRRTVRINEILDSVGITVAIASPGLMRLADFRTVHFKGVKLNGQVIGSFEPNIARCNYIRNVDGYTHLLAKTSSLGSSGDRFGITWKRSSLPQPARSDGQRRLATTMNITASP